jgi:hypothetical protein
MATRPWTIDKWWHTVRWIEEQLWAVRARVVLHNSITATVHRRVTRTAKGWQRSIWWVISRCRPKDIGVDRPSSRSWAAWFEFPLMRLHNGTDESKVEMILWKKAWTEAKECELVAAKGANRAKIWLAGPGNSGPPLVTYAAENGAGKQGRYQIRSNQTKIALLCLSSSFWWSTKTEACCVWASTLFLHVRMNRWGLV